MTEPITLPLMLQGRYRVGAPIVQGEGSQVYRGRDMLLGRDVAIKVVPTPTTGITDVAAQEREARLLASLNHPALVTLLDAGVDATDPRAPRVFLVMEFLPDLDLRSRIRSGRLSAAEVAYLGFDLLGALEHVHEQGLLHLDVKPENVLLARSTEGPMRGKLAGFEVALLGAASDRSGGRRPGAAAYLSPEQLEGRHPGPPSDIYSLGRVLAEALTGHPAFPGAPTAAEPGGPDPGPAAPAMVPAGLADLLRRMTAGDAGSRPTAIEAMTGFRDLIFGVLGGPDPHDRDPELERIAAVRDYKLIDTAPDAHFDRITGLAARVLRMPVAIISAVDDRRVWLKSHHGLDASERERPRALGVAGGLHEDVLILEDVLTDPRTTNLPPDGRGFRFYAGVPLITEEGFNVGTFAVADYTPRSLSASDLEVLKDLAAAVLHEMNLRRAARRIAMGRLRRPD